MLLWLHYGKIPDDLHVYRVNTRQAVYVYVTLRRIPANIVAWERQ
jgi:hypothetical protein